MALNVEVAGFGLCQTSDPYAVFVICVQQEKFEAWTVYRRYNSFQLLRNQLATSNLAIPIVPVCDATNLSIENLEGCRTVLHQWLVSVAGNADILRMQSMYQFLCIDANMPPPYLEIHWHGDHSNVGGVGGSNSSEVEEMDMEDLFDGRGGIDEMEEENDDEEDDDDDEDGERKSADPGAGGGQQMAFSVADSQNVGSVFGFAVSAATNTNNTAGAGVGGIPPRSMPIPNSGGDGKTRTTGGGRSSGRRGIAGEAAMDDDDNVSDEMEIKSLSVVQEAEFIYNKTDEGRADIGEATDIKRTINLDAFEIIKVIGKGSFGKVFLVRDKSNGTLYALKVLKKEYIIRKNQVEHTKTERSVLGYVHHPYIVGLNMAFQTQEKLFLVLDYCPGGELFFHLGQVGRFPELRAKFYAAQIILALEYIHKMDVVYRDLKPENVLLDQYGNVRLTDFGLSKEGVSDHSTGANSFCGTPEYIAPEVLLRQGHGRAVDWWSLGALLFEMITGLPPFYSRNRETMFEKIMKAQLNFPPHVSPDAKDLLTNLLVRDPKARLGSGDRDAEDIKEHAFFADIDWAQLATGKLPTPFVPKVAGSLDTSLFDPEFTSMMPIVSPDVRGAYFGSLDKAFEGFTFVDDSAAAKYMMRNHGGHAAHGHGHGHKSKSSSRSKSSSSSAGTGSHTKSHR